ncbi:MAG: Nif3-like dinuclear metal center hexameric protein [Clostridia bacterium]|nr:Nif3-like dinuclear metal center hexameric protein [Clostridia bacterium]
MLKLNEFMSVIDNIAPLSISCKMIEQGDYDNSGVIVKCSEEVNKILFSLDLSNESIDKALELGCDTVVTHHPAIYNPIKRLSIDDGTAPIVNAIKNGVNVISMHLNLDMANGGIDASLSSGLGVKNAKIIEPLCGTEYGYGRQGDVDECSAKEFLSKATETFKSERIIFYGAGTVKKVASFCGGGDDYALKAVVDGVTDADTIVTSDMPHHVLKELIERGKNVMLIPHYVSEQYGFEKFYSVVSAKLCDTAKTFYFIDERFM